MKYIKIKDWERWQNHRKDRGTPPWIKVYRNLFSNPDWMELSDCEKGQLVSMWIAAADKLGIIPNNPEIIRKMCFLDKAPDLQRFKDLGFLGGNVTTSCQPNMTAGCQPDDNQLPAQNGKLDLPETETETETEAERTNKGKFSDSEKKKPENLPANKKALLFDARYLEYQGEKDDKDGAEKLWNYKIQTQGDVDQYDICLTNYYEIVDYDRKNGFPGRKLKGARTWFNTYQNYLDQQPAESGNGVSPPKAKNVIDLKALCITQLEFVTKELDEGQVRDFTWFHMALDKHVLEYEQRFGQSPFNADDIQTYRRTKEQILEAEEV